MRMRQPLMILTALLLAGCVSSTKDTVLVAGGVTTPFEKVQKEAAVQAGLPWRVAVLPFINVTDKGRASEVVRRTIFSRFAAKNYKAVHWKEVDQRLKQAGFDDPLALKDVPIDELCRTLGVDGVMFGEIKNYDRTYVLAYGQVAVGLDLRLVDHTGKEAWKDGKVLRKHYGGISTTPVGLIVTAVSTAMDMTEVNLYRATDELGRDLIDPMPEPPRPPGAHPPAIAQVVHDGVGKALKFGDTLQIGLEGAPGMKGFARIEGMPLIDLTEETPGQYVAQVAIGPKDNVTDVPVVGMLEEKDGVRSERFSPMGLLTIDNLPPQTPKNFKAEGRNRAVALTWTAPEAKDVTAFRVESGDTAQGPFKALVEVKGDRHVVEIPNFMKRHYRVIALDRAMNASLPAAADGVAYPDPRFGDAEPAPQVLPATIEGVAVMTAEGGPYHLQADAEVAEGATLLAAPGTVIKAAGKASLTVRGEMLAFGEKKNPVALRGESGANYGTLLRLASEKPVTLAGLEVTGGGTGIEISRGAPLIMNSRIVDNALAGLNIIGVGKPVIRDSEISGSQNGVVVEGAAQPRFTGNRFVGNKVLHLQNGSKYRIDARGNSWKKPKASRRTILGDVDYGK